MQPPSLPLRLRIRTAQGETVRTFRPADAPITLGRSSANSLPLEDAGCSRHHAVIDHAEGQYRLRDLGSANGTRLNSRPADGGALAHGDRIRLGGIEITVELQMERQAAPPPAATPSGLRFRFSVTCAGASWLHEMRRGEETVGRGVRAGLRLEDPGCSRAHLRLRQEGGTLRFKDLGSANGTRLNAVPAAEGVLRAGDVLEIGAARLVFHPVSDLQRGGEGTGVELELTWRDRIQRYEMGQPSILVGRGSGCDIRLSDPACSRRQARLDQRADGLWVTDLGGANRTLLNGQSVGESRVAPGDVLGLGEASLRLVVPEEAPAAGEGGGKGAETGDIPLDDGVVAAVRQRILLTRKPPGFLPSAAVLVLGGILGILLAFWCAREIRRLRRPGPPPVAAPAPVLPPAAPPPSAPSPSAHAREAADAAHEARVLLAKAEDDAFQAALDAAGAARQNGDLRAARGCLTAYLEQCPPARHGNSVHERLAALDDAMAQQYETGVAEAARLAGSARFAEARGVLETLQDRFRGLPWGSAVPVRLQELAELEARNAESVRQEAARLRVEAEARRSAEDRVRARAAWEASQTAFLKGLPGLAAKTRAQRRELFAGIVAFDPSVGTPLLEALAREQRQAISRLKLQLGAAAVTALRQQVGGDLAQRRKAALALIHDTARYPYDQKIKNPPYGPDGPKVQREVEGMVDAVEACYRPTQTLLKTLRGMKGFEDLLGALDEVEGYLAQVGRAPDGAASANGVLTAALGSIDFAKEAEAAQENALILAANETAARQMEAAGLLNREEAACILRTNRYRIMMGLKPLNLEARLVQASRGHSRDMVTRGYFAHVDPDGKGPGDRARTAGFQGGVGENIYMGQASGEAAFQAWFSSSGHHRNMLMPGWTVIGVGQDGNDWTMMPGD